MGLLNIKNLASAVQQSIALNCLQNEVLLQPSVSINSTLIKESITESKVPCTSLSDSFISQNCGVSLQKEHQPESSTTVLTSDSTPSFIVVQDSAIVGLESKSIPIKLDSKKEVCTDSVHLVSTSSNPVVTSLLSPVKYINNEVSSQKFKLIFKGSGQGSNSPTGLVVPLNSSKTVPIKLVTLPGGGSALSVRSTSNPNIVEIIAPKTSASQSTQSTGNPHTSSPVRLVVSKMPSGLSPTNQAGTQNMRNRVVVNRVVMTGTSPSLKLVPTCTVSSPTAVLSNACSTATSSGVQSLSSSSHVTRLFVDEIKPVNNVEVSSMQLGSDTNPADQTSVETSDIVDNKISTETLKSLSKVTCVSTIKCSLNADSTTKDLSASKLSVKTSKPPAITPLQSVSVDSSTPSSTVSADTTSVPSTNTSTICNITSSDSQLTVKVPSEKSSPTPLSSEQSKSLLAGGDITSKKPVVADTTTGITTSSEMLSVSIKSGTNSEIKSETNKVKAKSNPITDKSNIPLSEHFTVHIKCENSVNEDNSRTSDVKAESEDLIKSEQNTDSAIKPSLHNISNEIKSSEPADSSSSNPCLSTDSCSLKNTESSSNNTKYSKNNSETLSCAITENLHYNKADNSHKSDLKIESPNTDPKILNSHTDNPLVFDVANTIENEVTIASNVEVEVSQNCELATDVIECAQNEIVSKNVHIVNDGDAEDAKKFRPLGEEESVVDSTDRVDLEDSQLEISLVYSKPVKRKCSENAAELIKACMGVEDVPKQQRTTAAVIVKAKVSEDIVVEKIESEKLVEENVRMSLRIRKDDPVLKKAKGKCFFCSTFK